MMEMREGAAVGGGFGSRRKKDREWPESMETAREVFVRFWFRNRGKRRAGGFPLFGGGVWPKMAGDRRGIGRGVVRRVWLRKMKNGRMK
ncbi:hypothetical protein HAX54_042543 [Datura stramonium]|uniref:Uncharacterized protein n=1 Tax=Datura stramonium TaxID=4076 RepID=A0ABS8VZJ9_DATST|nr:hypothetical protein [Datura stramonium]